MPNLFIPGQNKQPQITFADILSLLSTIEGMKLRRAEEERRKQEQGWQKEEAPIRKRILEQQEEQGNLANQEFENRQNATKFAAERMSSLSAPIMRPSEPHVMRASTLSEVLSQLQTNPKIAQYSDEPAIREMTATLKAIPEQQDMQKLSEAEERAADIMGLYSAGQIDYKTALSQLERPEISGYTPSSKKIQGIAAPIYREKFKNVLDMMSDETISRREKNKLLADIPPDQWYMFKTYTEDKPLKVNVKQTYDFAAGKFYLFDVNNNEWLIDPDTGIRIEAKPPTTEVGEVKGVSPDTAARLATQITTTEMRTATAKQIAEERNKAAVALLKQRQEIWKTQMDLKAKYPNNSVLQARAKQAEKAYQLAESIAVFIKDDIKNSLQPRDNNTIKELLKKLALLDSEYVSILQSAIDAGDKTILDNIMGIFPDAITGGPEIPKIEITRPAPLPQNKSQFPSLQEEISEEDIKKLMEKRKGSTREQAIEYILELRNRDKK